MTKTILLTGANGRVANFLRPLLRARYETIVLSDREQPAELVENEIFRRAELSHYDEVAAACDGVDAIIHLGGQPDEADWPTISASNIDGTYHIFEAARQNAINRVVFASSHHVVGMYGRNRCVGTNHQPRPDTRYGVSKVLGEALATFYADKYGLRTLSIRIGNVDTKPKDFRRLAVWLHPEDLMQLIEIGINSNDVHAQTVFGISENARGFWDNSVAFHLGYTPHHRAEDHFDVAKAGEDARQNINPTAERLQGDSFAALEFSGNLERVLKP